MDADRETPLIEMHDLQMYFPARKGLFGKAGLVRAVDGVTLRVERHETLGVVGESGCGKSTLARTIAGLYKPTGGNLRYYPPLVDTERRGSRPRPGRIQMVFQDPYGSFNPRMRARTILEEPLAAAPGRTGEVRPVEEAIEAVGLGVHALGKYAHEFSGGQRQRLAIARAIITRPSLIVADEAVSALDLSVQAQILNLLADLRSLYRMACLFISHDIAVVEHLSDRIAVMYAGEVVETAPTAAMIAEPRHPYTQALLDSQAGGEDVSRAGRGAAPSPLAYPEGCRFHPRCPLVFARCRTEKPAWRPVGENRAAACHLL